MLLSMHISHNTVLNTNSKHTLGVCCRPAFTHKPTACWPPALCASCRWDTAASGAVPHTCATCTTAAAARGCSTPGRCNTSTSTSNLLHSHGGSWQPTSHTRQHPSCTVAAGVAGAAAVAVCLQQLLLVQPQLGGVEEFLHCQHQQTAAQRQRQPTHNRVLQAILMTAHRRPGGMCWWFRRSCWLSCCWLGALC